MTQLLIACAQLVLETPLARGLIANDYRPGDTLLVDADMDAVAITIRVSERRGEGGAAGDGAEEPGLAAAGA